MGVAGGACFMAHRSSSVNNCAQRKTRLFSARENKYWRESVGESWIWAFHAENRERLCARQFFRLPLVCLAGCFCIIHGRTHTPLIPAAESLPFERLGFSQRYHSEDLLVFIAAGNGSNDSFITRALCLCADELNSGAFH